MIGVIGTPELEDEVKTELPVLLDDSGKGLRSVAVDSDESVLVSEKWTKEYL